MTKSRSGRFSRLFSALGHKKHRQVFYQGRNTSDKEEQRIREQAENNRELAAHLCTLAKELWKTPHFREQSLRLMQESRDLVPNPSKEKWLALRLFKAGKRLESRMALERALRTLFRADSEMMTLHKMMRSFFMEDAARSGFMMFPDLPLKRRPFITESGETWGKLFPGALAANTPEAVIVGANEKVGPEEKVGPDEDRILTIITDSFKAAGIAVKLSAKELPAPGSLVMELNPDPAMPELLFVRGGEPLSCGIAVPDAAGEGAARTSAVGERMRRCLARGNLVLALYSRDINNLLPQVALIFEPYEIPLIWYSFSSHPTELYERLLSGRRELFRKYPEYADPRYSSASEGEKEREIEIEREGETTDLSPGSDRHLPALAEIRVLVIGEDTEMFRANFSRQTYECREACAEAALKKWDLSRYQFITWFSDQDFYEEWYLEDMVNAFRITGADFVSKEAYYRGRDFVSGPECCEISAFGNFESTVFRVDSYAQEDILNKRFSGAVKGYAGDRFNYIRDFRGYRDPAPGGDPSGSCYPRFRQGELRDRNPALSVIIPVYNNGEFLYFKAFASLSRLTVFVECEIIIADDGSDDARTLAVINWLSRHYENVKACLLPQGGSGSASRPRNHALEMASGDYVLFFDPDDECLGDAYSVMLRQAQEGLADLVIGNNYRADAGLRAFNNYERLFLKFGGTTAKKLDNGLLISELDFTAPRIQSMLIKTDLARQISFVEGAIGEDTLYSWQIMRLARNIMILDRYTHVYYAGRAGSATNSFTPDMFRRLLKVQPYRIAWLKENGIFETYMKSAYKTQIPGRLNTLLKQCQDSVRAECQEVAKEISGLYEEAR